MTIAVNTRLLLRNRLEGIGWFTYETLKRIVQNHPEHHFVFIFDRAFDESFVFDENVTPVVLSPQARHPILYKIWFNWRIPGILKKYKADLFLSPDGYLSLKTQVPQLPVIHDLNFEHFPKDLPGVHGNYYRKYFPLFAKKASRVATVSEFSKQDIHEQYGVELSNIDVVYNGVGSCFKPLSESKKEEVRERISMGSPYFVFVGSLHPRKNIHRLFKAFDAYKKVQELDTKLVIVGQKFWWNEEIKESFDAMEFQKDVIFTGRLETEELREVLGAAMAMTFVPYFEGFGIPILEAFNCQVPVITSNVTSMPEVAGDAALLVNPFVVEEITEAMVNVANNEQLRLGMIEKGRSQVKNFSWDRTAKCLWESILSVLD